MTIDIHTEQLKTQLINIYSLYTAEDKKSRHTAIHKAKDLDGLWSGSFLLDKDIEQAIGGLRYINLEPKITIKTARQNLHQLQKSKNKP